MLSKIASTITSESLRVISTTRDTSSMRSAFVMSYISPSASTQLAGETSSLHYRPSPCSFRLIASSIVIVAAAACL